MPLVAADLQSSLEELFSSPPATAAECAQAWADAMVSYASEIVPASGGVTGAGAALSTSLLGAFESTSAAPVMESAFLTFATAVGAGMAGFTPAPPPSPIGFAEQFAAPHPSSHAEAAASFASLIDGWMRTGTATPLPSGSPVFWS